MGKRKMPKSKQSANPDEIDKNISPGKVTCPNCGYPFHAETGERTDEHAPAAEPETDETTEPAAEPEATASGYGS